MFIGDYEKDAAWSTDSLKGCRRFLDRVIRLQNKLNDKDGYTDEVIVHKTIKKVTNDILNMKYNTAVSSLMILTGAYEKEESITKDDYKVLLSLLNPIAPHITEELNEQNKLGEMLAKMPWPTYDEEKTISNTFEIGVQVNGKLRGSIITNEGESNEEILKKVYELDNIKRNIEGKTIIKEIVIPNKIVNIVIK